MKIRNITFSVEEYAVAEKLPEDDFKLLKLAEAALNNAYAPYSHFRVGAALRLSNGEIYQGNNQENAAYPSGLCAERVAMFFAKSKYPDESIEAIAVVARSDDFTITGSVSPCGSCRQVMAEYETQQKKPMRVIMMGEAGPVHVVKTIHDLLPLMFHEEQLKKKK
jgi:cytidine deaminase